MSKYFNPRLLNAVIAGTGMRNPVRPHVILGSEDGEFVRGDLMDANAIQEFVSQKIAELVDSAPEALDTLKELSAALNDDSNFATTIVNAINQKQDTLVSGVNIKTINGSSILGEGNIVLDTSTYKGLPETWDTTHSMAELIASINADSNAVPGKSYLGTVSLSDLPAGMMQAELIIDIMDQLGTDGDKVIVFSLSSADISPYKWEYTSAYGRSGAWRSWVIEQQQADWNLTDTDAVDYIKNKPDVALKSDIYEPVLANGHDYVEIGGIKWATMNVGANSVTDTGLYFQWGDTQGYTASQVGTDKMFNWANYKYSDSGTTTMTKYNGSDHLTTLEPSDDAAIAAWGGNWRIPTKEEFDALKAATTSAWTADYEDSGVAGLVLTSTADSSVKLFFPACGYCYNNKILNAGSFGYCWINSLTNDVTNGKYLNFKDGAVYWTGGTMRYCGCPIRGVLGLEDKYAAKAEVEQLQSNIVQSDWGQSDSAAIDYIKNKPTIPDAQIQSDWNQSDTNAKDYIKNKPEVALKSDIYTTATDANSHDYVEIGGIKWATMNVGANSVTDTGLYFQWGDTQGYTAAQVGNGAGLKAFTWVDYKYGNGTSNPGAAGMIKYTGTYGVTLELSDDAAAINWGGTWRIPTWEEYQALRVSTTAEWITDYQGSGVSGKLLTDKNDNTKKLFFPVTGYCYNGQIENTNRGRYATINLVEGSSYQDRCETLEFASGFFNEGSSLTRCCGTAVRGVLVEQPVSNFATATALSTLEARVAVLEAYHTT